MLGIQPGPTMLSDHLDIVWSLIWALVLANLICAVILTAAGPFIGRLGTAKASFLIPYVLLFALLGCYLFQGNWQNLVLVLGFGGLGYLFKRHDWPRAPFIIGVILGKIAEDSLQKAIAIFGIGFFTRPFSLVLITLIVASIGFHFWRQSRPKKATSGHA
jgi:putative tricarboxylic transport membrane protein